jgi:hypothetical protein
MVFGFEGEGWPTNQPLLRLGADAAPLSYLLHDRIDEELQHGLGYLRRHVVGARNAEQAHAFHEAVLFENSGASPVASAAL